LRFYIFPFCYLHRHGFNIKMHPLRECFLVRRVILTCIIFLFIAGSVQGQWFYFGRNKVQYTQFNWHILKTKHFDIYFYPEMEELAQIGATYAEESYRYLENKFNYTINRRIPLIFYSSHLHFQQTNVTPGFIPEGVGGFFEFLKGRVVIPSDGNLNQFKKVIQHELAPLPAPTPCTKKARPL